MTLKTLTTFAKVLVQHESFDILVKNFRVHQALASHVQDFLPASLKSHVKFGFLKKSVIYLWVRNNSWGTRCRYHLPDLLSYLRQYREYSGIASIQVRVETEAFVEADQFSTHNKHSAHFKLLKELIQAYADSTGSSEQKKACDVWLRSMQEKL